MAAQSTAAFIKEVGFYQDGQTDANGIDIGGTPIYVEFKYPKEILPFQPGRIFLKIISVDVINGGTGYNPGDTIEFTKADTANGEDDITDTATISVDSSGKITSIDLSTTGKRGSYLTSPNVSIRTTNGSGATLTVRTTLDRMDNPVSAVYQDMKFSVPILTMLPIPFIKVDVITIDFNAKITSMETQSQSTDLSVGVNLEVKQRWPGGSAKLNASVAYKKTTQSGSSVERTYSMAIHVKASQDEMPVGIEKLLGLLEGAMISKPA
jgi:hypothetical protein